MGYYNNANIETMMLGVPNMSYIRDDFRSIAPDCPIIVTRPETVYERLRYYVEHRDELRQIGDRGPAFVRKHHDPDRIALADDRALQPGVRRAAESARIVGRERRGLDSSHHA